MFCYKIKENDEVIGVAIGKSNAFEFINKILKRDDTLGIWSGLTCTTDENIYTIEKAGIDE